MATLVETPDVRILLDPSAALGKRMGLPPHPEEYKAVREATKRIILMARKCEVLVISHYHFDHFKPFIRNFTFMWSSPEIATEIYMDKVLLVKDISDNINHSQRIRGHAFHKSVKEVARKIEWADGRTFVIGDTKISFSPPMPHGEEGSKLGYVLLCTIRYGDESFLFAPDVQGPMADATLKYILNEKPSVAYIGGPPIYLAGAKTKWDSVQKGLNNLEEIVREIPIVIIDHHLLRDFSWRDHCANIFDTAERSGHRIMCAMEFVGQRPLLLEAMRRELYEKSPPSDDFIKWTKLRKEERRETPPPL
ncbi:MAG: MBL fold metallo-hydrolase [Candidatus Baldrarchaeia archaeon]|mgnify:CR=1 FL=1